MRGDNHLLAITTKVDEVTGQRVPLFSFPVQVVKATADTTPKWDNATPSGAETEKLDRIDPVTGEAFGSDAVRKGVRIDGEFREIPAEAIEEISEATKAKTMVALGKVDLDEAWAKYGSRVVGKYFLQSPTKGGSPTAYKLTYDGLLEVKKGKSVQTPARAIVTKRTARSRQALSFIYADTDAKCLVLCRVEFAANLREPDAQILAPQTAVVAEKQVQAVRTVIDNLPDGAEVLDTEIDEAIPMRAELIEKALAGELVEAPAKAVAETSATDDLEAALAASLAGVGS